jgi:glycosyltransferase involved in cell wall biosynthesis
VRSDLPRTTQSALLGANRVAAVSSWTRTRLTDLGVDKSAISILPNTVDADRFNVVAHRGGLRERYGLADDERVVLTVARLSAAERYKGYDRLIQALPSLNSNDDKVRLIIVGSGDDRARLEQEAASLGVRDRVTFAGFVADDDLADHYRMADVFAMPSTGEGFGIVFLEALACGTPVVAGNRDGSVDAVANGELGMLVDPLDVADIARGIASVLHGNGPAAWYDRSELHLSVIAKFGIEAFRARIGGALGISG